MACFAGKASLFWLFFELCPIFSTFFLKCGHQTQTQYLNNGLNVKDKVTFLIVFDIPLFMHSECLAVDVKAEHCNESSGSGNYC